MSEKLKLTISLAVLAIISIFVFIAPEIAANIFLGICIIILVFCAFAIIYLIVDAITD